MTRTSEGSLGHAWRMTLQRVSCLASQGCSPHDQLELRKRQLLKLVACNDLRC